MKSTIDNFLTLLPTIATAIPAGQTLIHAAQAPSTPVDFSQFFFQAVYLLGGILLTIVARRLTAKNDTNEKKQNELAKQVETATTKVETATTSQTEIEKRVDTLETDLMVMRENYRDAITERDKVTKEKNELIVERDSLKEDVKRLTTQVDQINKELEIEREGNRKLRSEMDSLRMEQQRQIGASDLAKMMITTWVSEMHGMMNPTTQTGEFRRQALVTAAGANPATQPGTEGTN